MDRRVVLAGFSLVELTVTIALVGILAIPVSGVVMNHLQASLKTDDSIAAANLARYEQELFERRDTKSSWCSVPSSELPPSDPDRPECPKKVKGLNPYVGLPFVVYRINEGQRATDDSTGGLRRISVKVKAIRRQETSGNITALEPLATVVTYLRPGVRFGT
ncbi:MAG: prepilin-type N-terminal cleavage/methylation domain-containing protein [Candidatus Omnitrophica bacterium]|nr:prepilin-type N-terminal cleavage/methylation domain-containing protein [Candidatus Omnitrophota bacterium]